MPGTADKVKFGVKNVHYALLTDEGTPTYGTPVAIPGAVSLSLEASGESTPFYADNMQYYVTVSNSGYETELEVAIFPDSFLKDVLGYTQSTTDKVLPKTPMCSRNRLRCYLRRRAIRAEQSLSSITAQQQGRPAHLRPPRIPPSRPHRPAPSLHPR